MRLLLIVVLLTATTCVAQEPTMEVRQAAPPELEKHTLTIPAGTRVPLTLTSPMRARATKKGDSVRAVTTFPVTAGQQVAIPAGTYVEGVIDKMIKRGPTGSTGLEMHFTRIVFPNGYNVPLENATAVAKAGSTGANIQESAASGSSSATANAEGFQQPPTPPPLPRVGPSPGVVAGTVLGVGAAVTVVAILLGRHRAGDIVFDSGYQFEMVLETSLVLDADRVADAMAGYTAQ
jgi:Bacterial conjugation TrbI-like protein